MTTTVQAIRVESPWDGDVRSPDFDNLLAAFRERLNNLERHAQFVLPFNFQIHFDRENQHVALIGDYLVDEQH